LGDPTTGKNSLLLTALKAHAETGVVIYAAIGKPWNDDEGSGFHLHVSLNDADGRNALNDDELFNLITDELAAGKIIGWVQGRMEFGPRALGCRSIIGDPTVH
jgi:hypothetical protein